uniref:Uncharacterized protein n=1 Tax=Brassica oleracea var. oleracea TaxID=109376 RepID=A0A0D3DPZ9_BRAOL
MMRNSNHASSQPKVIMMNSTRACVNPTCVRTALIFGCSRTDRQTEPQDLKIQSERELLSKHIYDDDDSQ